MSFKRALVNFVTGFGSQLILLILGIIVPGIVLRNYGSDTNGLLTTIGQIFSCLALLEAGISSSARNMLYKPIQDNNKDEISIWISAARCYYRKTTLVYFISVIFISLILPIVLQTDVNYWIVVFYTLFEGLTGVVSFYFLSTWNCFLDAKGEKYFINIVGLFVKILMYSIKIMLSIMGINIVYVQIGYFFVSLIQVLIYYIYMNRKYSWINYNAVEKRKLPERTSYVITEIAWTVFSSTDIIILSTILSTRIASVYSVYNMVFIALSGLLSSAYYSLVYILGQTFFSDINSYKELHDIFNSIFIGAMTILMCISYFLIIPFVQLYTEGVSDIVYTNKSLPILFCIIQLLTWSRYVAGNISGIAGYAKETARVSLAEACLNIVLSLILVRKFGIVGVLIATVIVLPFKVFFLNWQADRKILNRSSSRTINIILSNFLLFFATVCVRNHLELSITSWGQFFIYGVLLTIVFSIIGFIVNIISNKSLYLFIKRELLRFV